MSIVEDCLLFHGIRPCFLVPDGIGISLEVDCASGVVPRLQNVHYRGMTTLLSTIILSAMGGSAQGVYKNMKMLTPEEAQDVVDYAKYTGDPELIRLAETYQQKLDAARENGGKSGMTIAKGERIEKKATQQEQTSCNGCIWPERGQGYDQRDRQGECHFEWRDGKDYRSAEGRQGSCRTERKSADRGDE